MTKEKFNTFLEIKKKAIEESVIPVLLLGTAVSRSKGKLTREDCLDILTNFKRYEKEFNNKNLKLF